MNQINKCLLLLSQNLIRFCILLGGIALSGCSGGFEAKTLSSTAAKLATPRMRISALAASGAGTSTGTIYYATDTTVSGCAYDTANPSAVIQVHVYSESGLNPVVGLAGYGCPWNPSLNGHGFQIQLRRPLNSPRDVNVAFLNANMSGATWTSTNQAQHLINNFHRSEQTLLYNTANYQIGISLRYGAGISEYYNNRVDPTMNLVTADPGAMIQTAYFGSEDHPAFGGNNCVGNGELHYNPTQAGTNCSANGELIGSSVSNCTSSNNNALCNGQLAFQVSQPNDSNPDWIEYLVHYRNFFYPQGVTDYQSYDDVYGHVRYTFKSTYVQVDYSSWKTSSYTFGAELQQMPIAFLNQITKFTTDSLVMQKQPGDTRDYATAQAYPVTPNKSRWVLAEAVDNRASVPLSSPGDYLTMAFYSAVKANGNYSCPSRFVQADFLGAANESDRTWASVQHSSAFQNSLASEVLQPNAFYMSRAILSPFRPGEAPTGVPVSSLVNQLEANGGAMPEWECDQPSVTKPPVPPVENPTPVPTACKITQNVCPNHPSAVGTFNDDWNNSGHDKDACMQRASDFYAWCGGPAAMAGQTSTAAYYSDATLVQTKTVGTSCQISQSVCPSSPSTVGTFEDGWGDVYAGANADPNVCMQRAADYHNWCNSDASSTTTATFLSGGSAAQSTTFGGTNRMSSAASNDVLWQAENAIDKNDGTSYSSTYFSSSSNDRGSYLAAWLADGRKNVSKVLLTARMVNGRPLGFATNYDVYLTAPDNSRWDYIGNFDASSDSNGKATINLGAGRDTYGVLIIPRRLGVDDFGNYFFQLAEISLGQ